MIKVVAMIFRHIITELNGAKSEEDRIMSISKNCTKTHEENGCYSLQAETMTALASASRNCEQQTHPL
jgi:hypothetical protein